MPSEVGNILVNMDQLKSTIEKNFCCNRCRPLKGVGAPLTVNHCTFGIATTITITCSCHDTRIKNHTVKITPDMVMPLDNQQLNPDAVASYSLNHFLIIGMHHCGMGIMGLSTMVASMGIRGFIGSYATWKQLENVVGEAEIATANECTEQNLKDEIQASKDKGEKEDEHNRVPIDASFDGAWQKKGYDSRSGHSVLFGAITKKIMSYIVYAKDCRICHNAKKTGLKPFDHTCPKNFEGSSKSMEASGAVEMVTNMWRKTKDWVSAPWIRTFVSDDDSSTRSNLENSTQDKLDAKIISEWPWIINGRGNKVQAFPKSKDKGKLPLDIRPPWQFVADPSHRQKVFGKAFYKLVLLKLGTQVDAERMKRNFGYAQFLYHKESFASFCCRMSAVLQHHFNDHRFCDTWCKYKSNCAHAVPLPDGKKGRFRSKTEHPKTYRAFIEVCQRYMSIPMLRQIHHPFDSQKNEAFNKTVTKYAPKDRHYSQSMSLHNRVAFAVVEDSLGLQEGVRRIGFKLGIKMTAQTERHWAIKDRDKLKFQIISQSPITKKARSATKNEKIAAGLIELQKASSAHMHYKSGYAVDAMAAVVPGVAVHSPARKKSKSDDNDKKIERDIGKGKGKGSGKCRCGSDTHQRTSNSLCRLNKQNENKNMVGEEKEEERCQVTGTQAGKGF